jgi:DNA-binding NarL/FixJ family response regulator
MNNIFHKLSLRDRVELALYALRVGLITVHEQVR